jgi:predicted house-cleaning noncanonical NTP pyrophosphatase (MazG superfamily)
MKLVRNKLPSIITDEEKKTFTFSKTKNEKEFLKFLTKKLIEECEELQHEMTSEDFDSEKLMTEMSDVYEVLAAVQRHFGITSIALANIQIAKSSLKGTFHEGILLETKELQEEREKFFKWFCQVLDLNQMTPGKGPLGSCLQRDVLREAKEFLWAKWLRLKPWY